MQDPRREAPAYFNFWVPDFLGGVLTGADPLTDPEIAIYVLVLCQQWREQGPLDDDAGRIAKWCRRDVRPVSRLLDSLVAKGKLVREAGKIYNKRMQKEIIRHANRSAAHAAQKAVKQGGEQRRLPLGPAVIPGGRAGQPRGLQPAADGVLAALHRLEKGRAGRG